MFWRSKVACWIDVWDDEGFALHSLFRYSPKTCANQMFAYHSEFTARHCRHVIGSFKELGNHFQVLLSQSIAFLFHAHMHISTMYHLYRYYIQLFMLFNRNWIRFLLCYKISIHRRIQILRLWTLVLIIHIEILMNNRKKLLILFLALFSKLLQTTNIALTWQNV